MNILINCPSNFNINSKKNEKLGGVESLNYDLAYELSKFSKSITLGTNCKKTIYDKKLKNIPIQELKKNCNNYNFDVILSSNDASIFNFYKNCKKILWLHNKLQLEKAIRKNKIIPIIRNRPNAVFVSKYLENETSKLYFFNKRTVISNFLSPKFIIKKNTHKRNSIFVWSVKREKGLNETIEMWINKINPSYKAAKLYIFGVNKLFNKDKVNFFKSKNIFFFGRVSKLKLKNVYRKSLGMICLGYDETFCLNALEANACGLPILTFAHTALKDFAKNNYNSLIAKNFDELSLKILLLLNYNKIQIQNLSQKSFNHSKKFHLNKIINNWLKIIR